MIKNFSKFAYGVFVVGILMSLVCLFDVFSNKVFLEQGEPEEVTSNISLTANVMTKMIKSADLELNHSLERFSDNLARYLSGEFTIDNENYIYINGIKSPLLYNGKHLINLDYSIVDRLYEETGAVSTIFVRQNDDFIRISTSLIDKDGSRAVGTKLDRNSPAFPKILAGEDYVGPTQLFGIQYLTKYTPIKNSSGKVIGILFVGVDFVNQSN